MESSFFICWTSVISAPLVLQKIPAWRAAPNRWRKRCRSKKREERIMTKSRPTVMNLSSTVPTCYLSAKDPIAPKSPEKLIASGKKSESRMRRNSKSDAASSSQVKIHVYDSLTYHREDIVGRRLSADGSFSASLSSDNTFFVDQKVRVWLHDCYSS